MHDWLWGICYRGSMLWGQSQDPVPEINPSVFAFHDLGFLKTVGRKEQTQAGVRPAEDPGDVGTVAQ